MDALAKSCQGQSESVRHGWMTRCQVLPPTQDVAARWTSFRGSARTCPVSSNVW